MPLPCHAVPLRVWNLFFHLIYTVRPCLIHTCHAMPMPRPCPALTMTFFWRPRHRTAVERQPVGYLPPFGLFRIPHGVPGRVLLLSEAYQSCSQRSIPTTVQSGSNTLQKTRSFGLAVRLFPATTRTFTKDMALSEQGRGPTWHVWINGTAWRGNGMGRPWGRHGYGILRVNRPLHYLGTWCIQHYYRWCTHLGYQ